jgi:Flp pilus assembly protein TadD
VYILTIIQVFDGESYSAVKQDRVNGDNADKGSSYSSLIIQGKKHKQAREYEKALECFDQALKIRQDNAELWFDKGHTLPSVLYESRLPYRILQKD